MNNYQINLSYEDEDKTWYAKIQEKHVDVLGHGSSPEKALKCLEINLNLYLEALS
jgi:predicted RNase H-like HicB family nuclease